MVADFESFLKPVDGEQQQSRAGRAINVHEPSGFCVHRVSSFSDYQTAPYTYSGPDVIDTFYDHVLREARIISDILSRNVSMRALSDEQQSSFDAAVRCRNCSNKFACDNPKTRHHYHVTGSYLFPACNNCNLALKPRKSNRYAEGENNYLVLIVLHNNSSYDSHLLLRGFRRKLAEYRLQNGKVRYADIKIIPLNSEKTYKFRSVTFFSWTLFSSWQRHWTHSSKRYVSLEQISSCTRRNTWARTIFCSRKEFSHTSISDSSKVQETALPPKDAFF